MKVNLQNVTEPVTGSGYKRTKENNAQKNASVNKQEIFEKWQTASKGRDAKPAG